MEEVMSAILNTRVAHSAFDRTGGRVWRCLHSEREDICEAMITEPVASCEAASAESKEDAKRAAKWHRELLQARLRKIDDALDRLMSGSYGNCSKCGTCIEDTKLDFDPAIAFCIECWQREQRTTESAPSLSGISLETLTTFDTMLVRTRNSNYRFLMLDPRAGRALVEGGSHFGEPEEALLSGSFLGDCSFKPGWMGIGCRIQMWVGNTFVSTSPVQSFRIEHTLSDKTASSPIAHEVM